MLNRYEIVHPALSKMMMMRRRTLFNIIWKKAKDNKVVLFIDFENESKHKVSKSKKNRGNGLIDQQVDRRFCK